MIECTTGKKKWTRKAKVHETISGGGIVTPSDEAFTILCLENYWEKWVSSTLLSDDNNEEEEEDGESNPSASLKTRPKAFTKWTDSRQGHCQFGGWDDDGLHRFNDLVDDSKASRSVLGAGRWAEEYFVDWAKVQYGKDGEKGRTAKKSSLNRDFVVVKDDFDDEDDQDKKVKPTPMNVGSMEGAEL